MLVLALLSLLALLPATLTTAQPLAWNTSTPTVLPHGAQVSMTMRLYPGCATNKHVVDSHTAANQFIQLGGITGWDSNGNPLWLNSVDYSATSTFALSSTSTFTPPTSAFNFVQPNVTAGWLPIARVSPGMVVLTSGAVLLMGGKIAGNWALTNDVIMSTNQVRTSSTYVSTALTETSV